MSTDLQALKRAVARVRDPAAAAGAWLGSAFFIGEGLALTAWHVVAPVAAAPAVDPAAAALRVRLEFADIGHDTDATLLAHDDAADWALLRCAQPPTVPPLRPAAVVADNADWTAYGFPGLVAQGLVVHGQVRDAAASQAVRMPALQLFCQEAAAGQGAPLHGLSGSPCVVDDRVVGLLRATPQGSVLDGQGRPRPVTVAGTVWACPVAALSGARLPPAVLPLPADWFGPPPRSDFLVVRSRADAQAKRRLLSVASAVRDKLPGQALGAPQALDAEAAVASEAALLDATRWLCEAQVAVFDATGFEPAVMLLLGIRAVVRRGVTILSIGGDYAVGDPLGVPFNLMDANIVAHSARQAQLLDERLHPVPMLLTRIVRALEALESPHHVDLPVYEAVRRLPVARRGVRPPEDGVLVLCSFDPGYQQRNWPVLSEALKNQWENLKARLASTATPAGALGVARSFELNSPQLVSRAIYEEMRRARSCVVDLTGWSDAVLFELGVRLVVSRHPTACIVERQAADAETDPARLALLRLLVPDTLRYDLGQDVLVEPAWGRAYGPNATLATDGPAGGSLYRCVSEAIPVEAEPAAQPVFLELLDSAQLFAREALGSSVKPVGLYPGNARLTALEEQAEFDRLLAAFLFIRHRHGDLPADAGARQALRRSARQLFERHPSRTADMPPGLRQEIEAVLDQPE